MILFSSAHFLLYPSFLSHPVAIMVTACRCFLIKCRTTDMRDVRDKLRFFLEGLSWPQPRDMGAY
ncbi:hypothetical protein B0H19DRAFT_1146729 [Mycena capillaripes]|nr:hypothetical protein B0H19DRAFT_1204363 [Mycena capillaripes]KAJ6560183.1 hypothetical protein B0H19DRAFT_1146729 [Mycena capillaripes]